MTWKGFTAAAVVWLAVAPATALAQPDVGADAHAESGAQKEAGQRDPDAASKKAPRPEAPKVEQDGPACELHRPQLGHPPGRADIPPPCSGEPAPSPDGGEATWLAPRSQRARA